MVFEMMPTPETELAGQHALADFHVLQSRRLYCYQGTEQGPADIRPYKALQGSYVGDITPGTCASVGYRSKIGVGFYRGVTQWI